MRISDWSSDVCSSDLHDVRARIIGRHLVAVGTELGQDALRIDEILRTAERHHAHLGRKRKLRCHEKCAHIIDRRGIFQMEATCRDRKSTRLNSKSLMSISYAVIYLQKITIHQH